MQDELFSESKGGYFGSGDFSFGGCFVPEILYPVIMGLQAAYSNIFKSKSFKKEYKALLRNFVGRPTPLLYAKNASLILNNDIFLKLEGLANTGAHKINNAIAQVLLAKRMKKKLVIAETGAGQHGVAVSSACASIGIPCKIFMGEVDMQRQHPNVFIMEQFGATVVPVSSGSKTLKDAVNEALREWSSDPYGIFYVIGSVVGPAPYPDMVRDAQSIIGKEIKKQLYKTYGILPDYLIACVGGGSNAMGAFTAFLEDIDVRLVAVEAGGDNFLPNKHAMRLHEDSNARIGVAQGYKSYFLQDKNGQIAKTHSISAGLDYPGVGPQIAHLANIKRIKYLAASDDEAIEALNFFAKHEGILAALESSHALAGALKIAQNVRNKTIVINVSGRGDKDIFITAKHLCAQKWKDFLELELSSVDKKLKKKARDSINANNPPQAEDDSIQEQEVIDFSELSGKDLSFLDVCNLECNHGENISKDSKPKESKTANPTLMQDDMQKCEENMKITDNIKIIQDENTNTNEEEIQEEFISDTSENKELNQATQNVLDPMSNVLKNEKKQINQNQYEVSMSEATQDSQSINLESSFDSQLYDESDKLDFLTSEEIKLDSTEVLESICDELQVRDMLDDNLNQVEQPVQITHVFDLARSNSISELDSFSSEDCKQLQDIDFLSSQQEQEYTNTTQNLDKTNSDEESCNQQYIPQRDYRKPDSKAKVLETDIGLSKIWGKSIKS